MRPDRRAYMLRRMEINGERVRALMKRRGWSQAELARRAGVSQPTVWAMVHGQYRSPTSAHQVARALGVPVDLLFAEGPLPEEIPGLREEPAPYETAPPLTVAVFLDEGMAALEEAFRDAGVPYNPRAAALTVADWWMQLTEAHGVAGQNRIAHPEIAAGLRAALAREVENAARLARRHMQPTPSG